MHQTKHFNINLQYADDISEISTNSADIEHLKANLPVVLSNRGLILNKIKTEEYLASPNQQGWKNAKYLGVSLTQKLISKTEKVSL